MRKGLLIVIFAIMGNASYCQPWYPDSLYSQKQPVYQKMFDPVQSNNYIVSQQQTHLQTANFKQKKLQDNPFLFYGFVAVFLLALFTVFITPEYFRNLIMSISKSKYLVENTLRRKTPFLINNIILDILFVVVFSLFLFQLQWQDSHYMYAEVLIAISSFYFIQLIIITVAYYVFFGSKYRNIHIANILYFNRTFLLFLIPVCFLITYSFDPVKSIFSSLILFLTIVIIIFRILRTYLQLKKQYSFNAIYIILYLCVFEISLYFIFIKEFYWLI